MNKPKIIPLHSISVIKDELLKLKQGNWDSNNFEKFIQEFKRIVPAFIFPATVTLPKGTSLFRARINSPGFCSFADTITQLEARKSEDITSFGRAHCPGQSVFYAGNHPNVAISETVRWHVDNYETAIGADHSILTYMDKFRKEYKGPEEQKQESFLKHIGKFNDYYQAFVTLSEWVTTENIGIIPIIDPSKIRSAPNLSALLTETMAPPKNLVHGSPGMAEWQYFRSIMDFFADEFSRTDMYNQQDYLLTAAIAKDAFLLSRNSAPREFSYPGGIAYLSVANNFEGQNIALFPTVFSSLSFVKAKNIIVTNMERSFNKMLYGVELTDKQQVLEQAQGFSYHIVSESTGFSEQTKEIFWGNGKLPN